VGDAVTGRPRTAATPAAQTVRPSRGEPSPALPDAAARRRFRTALLSWYRHHGRDLPWRRTGDPYHILVSEVMLQQTQVDRVLPKYEEWLAKYPTFESLAAAPEADVVRTWYPLGYNIRPRRLQSIAREAVARFDGSLPDDEATLRSFSGIGAYTAGAVMSFAFGRRAAILDTNVARVLSRVFLGETASGNGAGTRRLWELSRAVLPHRHVFDFNQGLMDLGAMVCTARKPRCSACPLARQCLSAPPRAVTRPAPRRSRR
jgi:A/G-specific adenine glycosylase